MDEFDRLIKAVGAGWIEAGFFELVNDIGLRALEAVAAGFAAFHVVVSENFDMVPPGCSIEVRLRGNLRGRRNSGEEKREYGECVSSATHLIVAP